MGGERGMGDSYRRKRVWVEMQGYTGLDDAGVSLVDQWSRLAPGICMAWVAVGAWQGSAAVIWALVPFAALGVLLPWHPFDLLYNVGLRHLTGTPPLPRHGRPRRFACSIATVWLISAASAFGAGAETLGRILGWSMAAAAAVPTLSGFCIPSFVYGLLFGKPTPCTNQ